MAKQETQCNDCRGRGGNNIPYTETDKNGKLVIKYRWQNCSFCHGRGMVPA